MRFTSVLIIVLVSGIALLFTACNPIFYAPNGHNVPLFREKKELRINVGLIATEDLSGPEVQAAYAVGKNIGIIANGTKLMSGQESSWAGQGYLIETGGGLFKPIGKLWVAEIYAGGGIGKVTNERQSSPYYEFDLEFSKFFVQPAIGFSTNYLDIAFSPKMALISYERGFTENYQPDASGVYHYYYTGNKTFFAFEPGFTIRGGWKYTKLQLQVVTSAQDIPNSQKLSVNLSLSVNLASRFRKVAK